MTQKSESRMIAVCTALSDCRLFQNSFDDTSPILSSIKISHAPNRSKELDPFAIFPPLIIVPMQQNSKCALIMLWSMHILNVAAQFWLGIEEFMQNDTIYDPLSRGNMVLHAPSDSSIPSLSSFSPFHFSPPYFNSLHWLDCVTQEVRSE